MNTTDEYRQKLVTELIAHSARIDTLVVNARQSGLANPEAEQELETLRAQQREITKKLHELEASGSNTWENIGDGG
ncbi:MAG: hypothetical protein NTV43_17010 [Methylococcales bacterium]|nr:hypothetical protein [Methylococcales bacterium]